MGLYCLIAFVILSLGTHSPDFRPDRAMRAAFVYRALLALSLLGLVGSVVVLINGGK